MAVSGSRLSRVARISRVFPHLKAGHWAIGTKCAVCGILLAEGNATALVPCATAATERYEDGPPAPSVPALVAHASCTTP